MSHPERAGPRLSEVMDEVSAMREHIAALEERVKVAEEAREALEHRARMAEERNRAWQAEITEAKRLMHGEIDSLRQERDEARAAVRVLWDQLGATPHIRGCVALTHPHVIPAIEAALQEVP